MDLVNRMEMGTLISALKFQFFPGSHFFGEICTRRKFNFVVLIPVAVFLLNEGAAWL